MDDWIGYAAGATTTLAFLPQVIKVWRSRSVQDISLGMVPCHHGGVGALDLVWAPYGSTPVVVGNVLILLQTVLVLVAKIRFTP